MPDEVTEDEVEQAPEAISQWEFIDRWPTRADVTELLETLPPMYGVAPWTDYGEFVIPLSQQKKIKVEEEGQGSGRMMLVERKVRSTTLYVSVAGRIAMLRDIGQALEWHVSFEPELVVPDGNAAGFVELTDKRLVYREYCTVMWGQGEQLELMGRRPGMAWVPYTGGSAAAGSNPYEKVETAARGRSIAAWGIGVLPGSGVASMEEIQGASSNRRAIEAGGFDRNPEAPPQMSREQLLDKLLLVMEEVRQLRGITPEEANAGMAGYVKKTFGGLDIAVPDETGEFVFSLDWSKVRDGQLQLVLNQMEQTRRKIAGEQSPV